MEVGVLGNHRNELVALLQALGDTPIGKAGKFGTDQVWIRCSTSEARLGVALGLVNLCHPRRFGLVTVWK